MSTSGDENLPSVTSFNQELWATIPQATEEDIDRAISSARETFQNRWSDVNGQERARLMTRLADLLVADAFRMARLETTDNGKVIRETENQLRFAARNYRFFAGYADKLYGEVIPLDTTQLFDYTLREPFGVAAIITAWNSPIGLVTNKLAPALAVGSAVVVKPSEHASATTLELGKLIEEAGFPEGTVNIVTGDGRVGDLLTKHPGLDKINFTGGVQTGRLVAQNASRSLVPVTLELGGKSPNMIFADADLDMAVTGMFSAAGQSCIAGSRLVVEHSVYDEVVNRLVARAREIRLGNPLDPATEMGPAANEAQYRRILEFIEVGVAEGAELVTGGEPSFNGELKRGFFISSTVFTNVDNKMTIAREEIFGPVLNAIPFQDEEQAIEISNETKYGLASGVWTRGLSRAHRLARRIRAGTVWVNTYRTAAAQAPFGGVRQSGYGRERGWQAQLEYTYVKNVMIALPPTQETAFRSACKGLSQETTPRPDQCTGQPERKERLVDMRSGSGKTLTTWRKPPRAKKVDFGVPSAGPPTTSSLRSSLWVPGWSLATRRSRAVVRRRPV